jgi:hypothetical protein
MRFEIVTLYITLTNKSTKVLTHLSLCYILFRIRLFGWLGWFCMGVIWFIWFSWILDRLFSDACNDWSDSDGLVSHGSVEDQLFELSGCPSSMLVEVRVECQSISGYHRLIISAVLPGTDRVRVLFSSRIRLRVTIDRVNIILSC